jgi:hypothetical protein
MGANLRGGLRHPRRVTIAAADRELLATKAPMHPSCFAVFLAPGWSVGRGDTPGDEWFVDLGA